MPQQSEHSGRSILCVFAHPDDEIAGAGGTIARYAAEGVAVHVVTATHGARITGSGRPCYRAEELPKVRESELRSALVVLGAHPPVLLGYRYGEVADADFAELVGKVSTHMDEGNPDVVITFDPTGITDHWDHKTMHLARVEAFQRDTEMLGNHSHLLYFAIPLEIAQEFDLKIEGPEAVPNVVVDISDGLSLNLKALRIHGSQMDIQEMMDKL